MAGWFSGASQHKVDGKGRVSIPVAFRRVLEENDPAWTEGLNPNLILVFGDQSRSYLEGYSVAAMNEVIDSIKKMRPGTDKRRYLEHFYTGLAQQMQVDDNGRLVLSERMRSKADITDEAYFVASGASFQIWRPEAYFAQADKFDNFSKQFGEDFDPLSLLDFGPED
ncbi:MAG: cell division/cell wall cluster transcriptional repressor MraZ [Rhodobacteraceae bacterium]|nr:cell division/cell wall cluster transcriptional repressor MraZ [Paracoccaceae bacterium]